MTCKILTGLMKHSFFQEIFTEKGLTQLKRYLVTGFTSFGIEYALFIVFYKIVDLHYITSNVIVFTVIFWFNYLANRLWSFKSTMSVWKQLPLYSILFAFNLFAANIFLMYLLTDRLGIPALFSKVLIMGAVVSWNFVLYKKVIYR